MDRSLASVELQLCPPYLCRADGRVWVLDTNGRTVWAYGGGSSGVVFLSNVEVGDDNVMYAGIVRDNKGSLIAFRPPVKVGKTPQS